MPHLLLKSYQPTGNAQNLEGLHHHGGSVNTLHVRTHMKGLKTIEPCLIAFVSMTEENRPRPYPFTLAMR